MTAPMDAGATDPARLARIALGHLVEPGNRDLGIIAAEVGPVAALHRLRTGEVPERLRLQARPRLMAHDPGDVAHNAIRQADRLGARIITPEDDEWPSGFGDLVNLS